MDKKIKHEQLGMNPSTASARLLKDLLYKFIVELNRDNCFHCNKKLTRDTFSIEHKVPWLHSENPIQMFFDLENISFSHLDCNVKASRSGGIKLRKTRGENEAWCSKCKDFLPKEYFYKNSNTWNGYNSYCKTHLLELTNARKKVVRAKT